VVTEESVITDEENGVILKVVNVFINVSLCVLRNCVNELRVVSCNGLQLVIGLSDVEMA
jgi:hypothetical protein